MSTRDVEGPVSFAVPPQPRRRSARRPRWVIAAVGTAALVAVTSLSACSKSGGSGGGSGRTAAEKYATQNLPGIDKSTVDAACKEGTLSLYTLTTQDVDKLTSAFKKDFPCISKVSDFQGSGSTLDQRFTSEAQAGKKTVDVWQNSSVALADGDVKKGMVDQWTPPDASNVPAQWTHAGYWYAVGLAPEGFIWNTQVVSPAEQKKLESITSWNQVADLSEFKGKTGAQSIAAGGSAQLPLYFMYSTYGGETFWKKMEQNLKITMYPSIQPAGSALASGAISLVPYGPTDDVFGGLLAKKAPVEWRFPSPGLANGYMIGLNKQAPHPNAAKLFEAWSLTVDGAQAWNIAQKLVPLVHGAKDGRAFASESWYKLPTTFYPADWATIAEKLPSLTTQFTSIFGK